MDFQFEHFLQKAGYQSICGVDEVGRGPLAGPVTVAAVILPVDFEIVGLKDSKGLKAAEREAWFQKIQARAIATAVVSKSNTEIDASNILKVTKQAMREAVRKLAVPADFILLDAVNIDLPGIPQLALIRGDAQVPSIAAASIVAKVTRDRLMGDYARTYPGYDFESNVGYGTPKHLDGLRRQGTCAIHRKTFLKKFLPVAPPPSSIPELA